MSVTGLILLAWAFEVLFGWPDWLFRRVRHPVVWLGKLISILDRAFNRDAVHRAIRYLAGVFTSLVVVGAATGLAFFITMTLPGMWWGVGLEALVASSLIASRSLHAHVAAVARPLVAADIDGARRAVSRIVGRDPDQLQAAGIARASLESLAENASDGVIAPLFWGVIFGLPGLAAYKAINTLDSMIGHRSERYRRFGGFAARLDDLANLIPARMTGALIAAASFNQTAWTIMSRDARLHRSPNAGWPEAAMAGALGVRLSGPRSYGHEMGDEPWLNAGARDPDSKDVVAGLRLYRRALLLAAGGLALIAAGQQL